MGTEHTMVVSPYNMQVELLRRTLPCSTVGQTRDRMPLVRRARSKARPNPGPLYEDADVRGVRSIVRSRRLMIRRPYVLPRDDF